MKIKLAIIGLSLIAGMAITASAQTNSTNFAHITPPPPPTAGLFNIPGISLDFLTNLPTASGFDTAKFGVEAGVVAKNTEILNSLKGDLYLHTNWMISLEIQNAPNVLNNASVYFGYRLMAKPSQELFAEAFARRTLVIDAAGTPPGTQGGLSVGYSFNVMTGGKFVSSTEARIMTSPHGPVLSSSPPAELVTYLKLLF